MLTTRTNFLAILGAHLNEAPNTRQPKRVGDSGIAASSSGRDLRPSRHSASTGVLREPYESFLVAHSAGKRLDRKKLAELVSLLPAPRPSGGRKKSGPESSSVREEVSALSPDRSPFLTWDEAKLLKLKLKNANYRESRRRTRQKGITSFRAPASERRPIPSSDLPLALLAHQRSAGVLRPAIAPQLSEPPQVACHGALGRYSDTLIPAHQDQRELFEVDRQEKAVAQTPSDGQPIIELSRSSALLSSTPTVAHLSSSSATPSTPNQSRTTAALVREKQKRKAQSMSEAQVEKRRKHTQPSGRATQALESMRLPLLPNKDHYDLLRFEKSLFSLPLLSLPRSQPLLAASLLLRHLDARRIKRC